MCGLYRNKQHADGMHKMLIISTTYNFTEHPCSEVFQLTCDVPLVLPWHICLGSPPSIIGWMLPIWPLLCQYDVTKNQKQNKFTLMKETGHLRINNNNSKYKIIWTNWAHMNMTLIIIYISKSLFCFLG